MKWVLISTHSHWCRTFTQKNKVVITNTQVLQKQWWSHFELTETFEFFCHISKSQLRLNVEAVITLSWLILQQQYQSELKLDSFYLFLRFYSHVEEKFQLLMDKLGFLLPGEMVPGDQGIYHDNENHNHIIFK